MRAGWSNFVKDYLTFSRKERRGIAVIVVLSVVFCIVPRFVTIKDTTPGKEAFQAELAQLKISIDTSANALQYPRRGPTDPANEEMERVAPPVTLFAFDPNTLDVEGWKKLGIREKTIQTIQHFIAKGFRFRTPGDLKRVYGLRADEAERLMPYVQILSTEGFKSRPEHHPAPGRTPAVTNYLALSIDINRADTTQLITLPGIGSKLAARIVHFRQRLGGFHTVDQVKETYGIPDSTFQVIKARLECINPMLTKINVNTATADELKSHPYISWNIANAIVNYRNQHGRFNSLEDLQKIEIISNELLTRITPYLAL